MKCFKLFTHTTNLKQVTLMNQSAEGTAFVWVHKTVQRPGKKTVQFKNTTLQIST